jgi:hypothetical protein
MQDSLRQVEVRGECPSTTDEFLKGAILNPLLKIKSPMKFSRPELDTEFQRLLAEAAKVMEAKSVVRRVSTAADTAERARRQAERATHTQPARKIQKLPELAIRVKPMSRTTSPTTDEWNAAHDLRTMPGYDRFKDELAEWDVVRSCSSRPISVTISESDEDAWTDTASPTADRDEGSGNSVTEDWVIVDKAALS